MRFNYISFLIFCIFPLFGYARTLSPQQALERAIVGDRSSLLRSAAGNAVDYKFVYSASSGAWHVFNRSNGGYIIVAGDDAMYPLLADVARGSFRSDSLAVPALEMLESYEGQLAEYLSSATSSAGARVSIPDLYAQWEAIPPVMTTHWDQVYPYNKLCPVKNGQLCVTGCTATAMAQVVCANGFYRGNGYRSNPSYGSDGRKIEFNYSEEDFDFSIMPDICSATSSGASIDEVARLMLACGVGVGMDYNPLGSGASLEAIATSLVNNFGYNPEYTKGYNREDFTTVQWESIIYGELALGRPVCYAGNSPTSDGHAYVIDGYRPEGMYHVNWGWGGMSDGYYRLSALIPEHVGTGGSEGGFTCNQSMVKCVPPDVDPGYVFSVMCGSISNVRDNIFSVYYFTYKTHTTDLGAVITNESGERVLDITFWQNMNLTAQSGVRHDSYEYDLSRHNLAPGTYTLYPAYTDASGKMVIASPALERPYTVSVTVGSDGSMSFVNASVDEVQSNLRVSAVDADNDLHCGYSCPLGFSIVNIGGGDFYDRIIVSLVGDSGEEVCSAATSALRISGHGNCLASADILLDAADGSALPVGRYALRFTDSEGNVISEGEYTAEVLSGKPASAWAPSGYDDIRIINADGMPSEIISGQKWPHRPKVVVPERHGKVVMKVTFFRPGETVPLKMYTVYTGSLDVSALDVPVEPFVVDLPFGTYEVCYRDSNVPLTGRYKIRVGASAGKFGFIPDSGNSVSVTSLPEEEYAGDIDIPATVAVDGMEYYVSAIGDNAFASCHGISTVTVPSTVRRIGLSAFAFCSGLHQLIIKSASGRAFSYAEHPGLLSTVETYVPAEVFGDYKETLSSSVLLYAANEFVESKSVHMSFGSEAEVALAVAPVSEDINPGFRIISDSDSETDAVASVGIVAVKDGRLTLRLKAVKLGTTGFTIVPAMHGAPSATLTLTVTGASSVPVTEENIRGEEQGYDILGRKATGNTRLVIRKDSKTLRP